MWEAVDTLIARAPDLAALRWHRLELLAARREGPGGPLSAERRRAVAVELAVPHVLGRAREAWDGRLVLFKGPEVARRYPAPATRPFGDLDLLVDDAEAAQRALLAAGFQEVGSPAAYVGIHHLRPLWWPGTPLTLELHSRPKWPRRLPPPPAGEWLAHTTHAETGVPGVEALEPAAHALVLATHAWAHAPLGRAGHLLDIAAVQAEADPAAIGALARRWYCSRLWRTTHAAAVALVEGGNSPAIGLWARHLRAARERTVLEAHAQGWLAPLWGLRRRDAGRAALAAVAHDLRRAPSESWRAKLARSRQAVGHARVAKSDHQRGLEARG